jgi:hypothetical protein
MTTERIRDFKEAYNKHKDDPRWLSDTIVELATEQFYHNTEMAEAEEEETRACLQAMITIVVNDKVSKVSVAEAEKRAIQATGNKYGVLKVQAEAIESLINAIKVRVKVLEWEKENA